MTAKQVETFLYHAVEYCNSRAKSMRASMLASREHYWEYGREYSSAAEILGLLLELTQVLHWDQAIGRRALRKQ